MINLRKKFLELFKPADKKAYLKKLVHNIEEVKNSNAIIPFTIQELRRSGFLIKAGGLFGFVQFEYMPWHYNSHHNWKSIASYLVGHKFFCYIYHINANPIQLIVDGKAHTFHPIDLEEGTPYIAIVLQKTEYGLFLEIGYHFQWKHGSIVGLAHKTTFIDPEEFNHAKQGDTLTTYFHGYTSDKKILLGDTLKDREWLTGELDSYVGTIQEARVLKNHKGNNDYVIKNKYRGYLTVNKTIYADKKSKIKTLVKKLAENEIIVCEIIGVNKRAKMFQLKLTDKYLDDKT